MESRYPGETQLQYGGNAPRAAAREPRRTQIGLGAVEVEGQRASAGAPAVSQTDNSAFEAGAELEVGEGSSVRQYEIIRELGRGGMGRVMLARDTMLGRRVALKFLISSSEQFNQRFLIEARTTAQVNHENIVIIHEANEFEGAPYMALEYLEGESLGEHLLHNSPPPNRVVEIMVPVVRALVRAHEFGIMHRDLKPENIFITDSGQIKVLDFGIAKLFSNRDDEVMTQSAELPEADLASMRNLQLTGQGAILGTMPYMSPEQWGAGTIDLKTDIWAVGIMLFEMLAGSHPLEPLTPQRLLFSAAHPEHPLPSIASRVAHLSPELVAIVDLCLQQRPEERFASAADLLENLESLLPGRRGKKLSKGGNPFPGLGAFQEQDADRFFGRSNDITRALKKIRERPLLGIVGPSGVGKSSMVRAGLVPALKASGDVWETFTIRPGRDPLASLATVLQPLTNSSSTTVDDTISEHQALIARIRKQPGYVGSLLRKRARDRDSKILVFVDQFEELYTLLPDKEERDAFAAALVAIADDAASPLRAIVSMRSDFLDRVGENEIFLGELTQGLLFLQPPDREGLREALTQPIEMAGYAYQSPEMVSEMLDSLATTPGALPLLQFAAAKLWDHRDRTRKLLSEESYRQMGGVAGTLAAHANEVLAGLTVSQQKLVRNIFQRLVTPDGTRAITDVSELEQLSDNPEEVNKLISTLVHSRLLVVQSRNEAECSAVEIVHESLITQWPTLRHWLEEGQEDSAFLEQLRTASRQWEQKRKPVGLLWRDEAMEEAERFQRRFKGDLASRERAYLAAVMSLASRRQRRKRGLVIGGFAFLSALVVAGVIALFTIRNAEQEAVAQAEVAKTEKVKVQRSEEKVRKQLELIQEKEDAKTLAEKEAAAAAEQANQAVHAEQVAKDAVAMSNEELKSAYEKVKAEKGRALSAQAKAEEEKRKARAAQNIAEAERAKAIASQTRAEKAQAKTKVLLDKRDAEVAKLRAQGKKINKTLAF